MIFIDVSLSRNKDACKYKLPRANYKQKVDCWGFLLDPQQTPHSTTTGTAGTWQQTALQQQPLLPYWKFNFVKKSPHYFSDMHAYRSEKTQFARSRAHLVFFFLHTFKLFKNSVGKGPAKCWCVKSTWTSALLPYEWAANPAALSRAPHWWRTTRQADRELETAKVSQHDVIRCKESDQLLLRHFKNTIK